MRLPDSPAASEILCRLLAPELPLPIAELEAFASAPPHGALVTFFGVVRPIEEDREIRGLLYEAHESLAQRELERVTREVAQRFAVRRIACAHRTGFVGGGEPSVAIYVSADHRGPAFQACETLISELKQRVPIWKSPVY